LLSLPQEVTNFPYLQAQNTKENVLLGECQLETSEINNMDKICYKSGVMQDMKAGV
jgi:hypothetical protein